MGKTVVKMFRINAYNFLFPQIHIPPHLIMIPHLMPHALYLLHDLRTKSTSIPPEIVRRPYSRLASTLAVESAFSGFLSMSWRIMAKRGGRDVPWKYSARVRVG